MEFKKEQSKNLIDLMYRFCAIYLGGNASISKNKYDQLPEYAKHYYKNIKKLKGN